MRVSDIGFCIWEGYRYGKDLCETSSMSLYHRGSNGGLKKLKSRYIL